MGGNSGKRHSKKGAPTRLVVPVAQLLETTENKNQTDFSAMGPTIFELWVMEIEL